MQNAVSNNPNASVTAVAGAVTIVLIWVAGIAGLAVPAEVASAFTTVVAAVILWVGRRERRAANVAVSEPSTAS
jgi:threonine/homoserine/homoserine lactone efflux protein